MLEAVGFPVAVNPETRLAALARKRGWLVEQWSQGARRPSAPPARSARCCRPGPQSRREHGAGADEGVADRAQAWPASPRPASAGSLLPARGAHVRPLEPRRRRPARPARRPTGCASAPAWPDLRQRPGHRRRRGQPVLRARSSASRSCPATRWWPTPTTTGGSSSSRCSAAWPAASTPCARCAAGRPRQLRAPGVRAPRRPACRPASAATPAAAGAPNGRPREPAPRGARRHDRRGRGDGRADRLRGARRAAAPPSARATRSSCSAPARSACSPSPRCAASPRPASIIAAANYPSRRRWPATLGADSVCEPERARPRRAPLTAAWPTATSSPAGCDVVLDCVGSSDSIAQSLGHRPAPGHRGAGRHAGPGEAGADDALAPGDAARRRLRLRHRSTLADGEPRRTFDLAFELVRPPISAASSRPRTRSPTTRTPSSTPPTRAAAAP